MFQKLIMKEVEIYEKKNKIIAFNNIAGDCIVILLFL